MKLSPARLWKPILGLVAVLGAVAFMNLRSAPIRDKSKPLELGFWYWHSPLDISPEETTKLKAEGLNKLFVRAGTFSTDGGNAVLVIPQTYRRIPDLETHLVFNFDAGFVRHFEEFDLDKLSNQASDRIKIQIDRAQKLGVKPTGIQLDLDCPTRLLPRYARFVKQIKAGLGKELKWSTTALMSWLGTAGVETLSKELDFIIPQAYEGETGRTVSKMRPVSDPDYLRSVILKAEKLKCPYYFGIPAYGHGFIFDDRDQLVDIYQSIGPAEAMRHPSFKLIEAYPSDRFGQPAKDRSSSVGEQIIKFKAIRPTATGRGLNYTLAYTIPTPDLLSQMKQVVQENAGPNCFGAIIYRFPEPKATLNLTLGGIHDVLDGKRPRPDLVVKDDRSVDNFEVIEKKGQASKSPVDIFLSIENTGNAATFVAPDAVQLILEFSKPGVGEVRLRDFDTSIVGALDQARKIAKSSSRNASAIQISKSYLAPGEKAYVGPIRLLESNTKISQIRWIIRDGNGFDSYSGTSLIPTEPTRTPLK